MNQAGRDALRAAALAGVVQIARVRRDVDGGRCALGALELVSHDLVRELERRPVDGCHLCGAKVMGPYCGELNGLPIKSEDWLAAHLNNDHQMDFLGIAEKMPVSPEL